MQSEAPHRRTGRQTMRPPGLSSCLRQFGCLLLTISLTNCAQLDNVGAQLGIGTQVLTMYPGDACYRERGAFNNSPNFMTQRIVTSAAAGLAGGAVVGAGTAAATHGNVGEGALIGAAAGLAGGSFVGYMSALQQEHLDQATLARRVNSDITTESRNIDRITATFATLRECRFAQATRIKQQERARRIDVATARQELAFQRDRFAEEIALARGYNVNMGKHEDQFQDAATTLRKNNAPNASQIQRVATETIPEKRSGFDNSVEVADSKAKVAFNLDDDTKSTENLSSFRRA